MSGRTYPHAVLLIFASIILQASCTEIGSITFVIDETASMHNEIRQIRSSLNHISDKVVNELSSEVSNMVLVTFNDPDAMVRVVTQDLQTFKRKLDEVHAHNPNNTRNLDCWEPSMNGLLLALETSNRESYIYVFTDAPAKDYRDSHKVIKMCQEKQTQIVFVLTGRCGRFTYGPKPFDVYFDIAQACGGQAFVVKKNEVGQVFEAIAETIKDHKTVITSTAVPAGIQSHISFTVDELTDYAIVSVSGKNIYLDIKGPSASFEKMLWNKNVKVVKLSNATKPSPLEATVMSETRATIVIVGKTNFFFTHGFSEQKPKSLGNTALQPIAESNVRLSISVTDNHDSVQVVSAEILDMNEEPIRDPLPLSEIYKSFYVTDLFVVPSQRFKVVVNGIVKATGHHIRRFGEFPVAPQEPPKESTDALPVSTEKS